MIALFVSEVRRDLSRRLVWVLIALALVATAIVAALVYANAEGPAGAVPPDPFSLTELWPEDRNEGPVLAVPIVFLAIGGLLAGASMVGAEWKAGTITTLLTWEPRRMRVAAAKLLAAAALAFLIGVLLLAVFSAALVPAGLRGSSAGADASWFWGLVAGILRGGVITAFAATFGAGVAMVGRNTAAALGVGLAYIIVGENIVRVWKPWLQRWLVGENSATFLLGGSPDAAPFHRSAALALATLVLYVGVVAAAAVASFRARDIAST